MPVGLPKRRDLAERQLRELAPRRASRCARRCRGSARPPGGERREARHDEAERPQAPPPTPPRGASSPRRAGAVGGERRGHDGAPGGESAASRPVAGSNANALLHAERIAAQRDEGARVGRPRERRDPRGAARRRGGRRCRGAGRRGPSAAAPSRSRSGRPFARRPHQQPAAGIEGAEEFRRGIVGEAPRARRLVAARRDELQLPVRRLEGRHVSGRSRRRRRAARRDARPPVVAGLAAGPAHDVRRRALEAVELAACRRPRRVVPERRRRRRRAPATPPCRAPAPEATAGAQPGSGPSATLASTS